MGLLFHVAEKPRRKDKVALLEGGSDDGRNTTKHAATVVSTVRQRYVVRRGRAVGLKAEDGRNHFCFLEIKRALVKRDPAPLPPRQPILAKHMRMLYAVLDTQNSHRDRAFWCLVLSCFLGVRRIGDFLSSREERRRGWRRRFRTHRGRLEIVNLPDGEDLLVAVMKPLKEDPEASNYQESVYKTGPRDAVLCVGNAW